MNDLFKVSMKKDQVWEMSHFHFHEHYELLFVTSGTCSFLLEDEMIQATRGTVLLMPGGLLHMSTSLPDGEYARYVLSFTPGELASYSSPQTDILAAFKGSSHFLQLTDAEVARMEPYFRDCVNNDSCFGQDLQRNLSFLEILLQLGRMMQEDRSHIELPTTEDSTNFRRVRPIISYILENPADNLGLDPVAELFFYNKHYLCRIFKAATGISVGKFITAVRVQYASTYLRSGSSVQESGERAGFKNNSNFISTFRKVMGISPGQYRQRSRVGM